MNTQKYTKCISHFQSQLVQSFYIRPLFLKNRAIVVLFLFVCIATKSTAQDGDQEGALFNASYEFGAHVGNILPNQVEGATEIQPQWGLRAGFGLGGAGTSEFTFNAGKDQGVDWKQMSASVRMDMPIEELVGHVYVGLDLTMYESEIKPRVVLGGGHIGGGVMALLSKDLWFRADMKFNINPGTSLFIGGGFLFRFGSGQGS